MGGNSLEEFYKVAGGGGVTNKGARNNKEIGSVGSSNGSSKTSLVGGNNMGHEKSLKS